MRPTTIVLMTCLTCLLLLPHAALAATADENGALALAALVGIVSPLGATEKEVL